MIPGEALLDAFINANILVCIAYVLWLAVRGVMNATGLKHAHGVQLRLLNATFLVIVAAPFLVLGYAALRNAGMAGAAQLNLSDMFVSYYLGGGFEMAAADVEGLLQLRDTFILNLMQGAGWLAKGVIAAFLIGLVLGAVRLVYSVACLRRIVRGSYAWRQFGRIHLLISDRTLVPFSTRGLRNYYVVVPSHMLSSASELKVSLAHEFQHIRQGDLEWEIVLETLKPVFFLNPVFHAWKRQVEQLREFNCDTRVLSRGRIDVRSYCDTLLSVCQTALRRDRTFVIAVPKVTLVTADRSSTRDGKLSTLERRILSALDGRPSVREGVLFLGLALPLIAALALTTIAIQRPGDWSQDRLTLSTVVNLERLDKINRLSAFGRIRE